MARRETRGHFYWQLAILAFVVDIVISQLRAVIFCELEEKHAKQVSYYQAYTNTHVVRTGQVLAGDGAECPQPERSAWPSSLTWCNWTRTIDLIHDLALRDRCQCGPMGNIAVSGQAYVLYT